MSYHGLIPLVKSYLQKLKCSSPAILEIGVDRGVTFLSLTTYLARTHEHFFALGVDILVQETAALQLQYLDLTQEKQMAVLIEGNSLNFLPELIKQEAHFDVVMLDGDHNYDTVSKELVLLKSLVNENSIIVVDDYDGRWSERDLWYAERDGYENVKLASAKVDTEKHGVKPAVDDFLIANPNWKLLKPVPGEPIVLIQQPI